MEDVEEVEEGNGKVPILLKMTQLQGVYQTLTEFDEEGTEVPLKMQASTEFKLKFNEFVHKLIIDCVNNARKEGRKMLMPEDVPELVDVQT